MISIKNVSFGYEKAAGILKNINLDIKAGECILLCGESGCGKTTITKLINGLIPHFTEQSILEGNTLAAGMNVADTELYELAKSIGSVFQNPKSQFFNLDTDSELAFGLENEGIPPENMKQRIEYTVEQLQIQKLKNRNIFSLSGGEKQMLAFASVYAMNPSIYVLDEPTANLDTKSIERLKQQITSLKQEGHTVVIAEHRLYFLSDLIDWAAYIKNGEIIRTFDRKEFAALTVKNRIEMGLRTLTPVTIKLPTAGLGNSKTGLSVNGLTCGYKKAKTVINGLSFSALPGEVLAITGYNGAGKTTLIRCLCGLTKENSGHICLEGQPIQAKSRRKISFCVMQDVNHQLFSDSVRNECKMAAPKCPEEKIEEALNMFGLLPFKEHHPMALSGGQKQRLAIITALLSDKKILIFDEPTSGLDYVNMKAVSDVIRNLAGTGHIVLVVTHDLEFINYACDRILEIK